jgi:hypothetical protein
MKAVRKLHRVVEVCPEADDNWGEPCPCGGDQPHYFICAECCCDQAGNQTEECAYYHDDLHCPTIRALDGDGDE